MPSGRPPLTQARLKELLHYNPETGVFTWRIPRNCNNATAGSSAGSADQLGYVKIRVDRRLYKAHRLAFLYMLGEFPPDEVDHIDRDPSNNRWENLRSATRSENAANRGLQRNNTSGHRGVTWSRQLQKWMAQGQLRGRMRHLGYFTDIDAAASAARKWREETFGEASVA